MEKNIVLIVDDVDLNRKLLASILDDDYAIVEANGGKQALDYIRENFCNISLILLDLMMPDIDGISVLKAMKNENISGIPVIIITASNELELKRTAFELGAVDYILKPFEIDVKFKVDTNVKLRLYQHHLEEVIEKTVAKMAETWTTITQTMAEIIEYRNLDSGQHVKRTSMLAKMILTEMNRFPKSGYYCSAQDTRIIYEAAALHDVGKIAIPDNILLKPGRLTEPEFEIMKTHTLIGFDMANKIMSESNEKYRAHCSEIALYHHERWDGLGYPHKLKGMRIPLTARIVSIVDTYDAITNNRPYHKARTHEEAMSEIKRVSGAQFDPYLVEIFQSISDEVEEYAKSC